MKHALLWAVAAVTAILCGCTTTGGMQNTHFALAEHGSGALPSRVLQLPIKVTVNEISVGGVTEPVPGWGKTASDNVTSAVTQLLSAGGSTQFVNLPALTAEEQSVVDEHLALYEAVAYSAYQHTGALGQENAWPQKLARFDYTVGPGLSFLRQRTGADSALIVVGEDNVSSAGRKAAFVVAAMLGIGLQLGYSGLTAGIVDLQTGNVQWLDFAINQATIDLRTSDGARDLVGSLFQNMPGRSGSSGQTR